MTLYCLFISLLFILIGNVKRHQKSHGVIGHSNFSSDIFQMYWHTLDWLSTVKNAQCSI